MTQSRGECGGPAVVMRLPWLIGLLGIVLSAAGCTVTPTRELADYREAFQHARTAGEVVLFDYAAAKKSVLDSAPVEQESVPARPNELSHTSAEGIDEVETMMKAWEVIDRYNAFLLTIAEGKEQSEINAAYQGFQMVSKALPAKLAETVGGALGPWQPLLDLVVQEAAAEAQRRRILLKIKEGTPTVAAMLKLLRESADDIYGAEYLVNDHRYLPIQNRMSVTVKDINSLFSQVAFPEESDYVDRVAKILDETPGYDRVRVRLPAADAPTRTPIPPRPSADVHREHMDRLVQALEKDAAVARALTRDLLAKKRVAESYRDAVVATEQSVQELYRSAVNPEFGLPDAEFLERAVIELRRALETNGRKEWIYELAR